MDSERATIGTRVRSTRHFAGIPCGTEGVIDEDYGTGVTVAWDLPDRPLPAGWSWDPEDPGKWAINPKAPLRDGFDKADDLRWLEVVSS